VIAATSCPILITSAALPDNPITYANDAFCALSGYSQAEVVGRNWRFLQGTGTDVRVKAEIAAAVAAGTSIRREILNYRKDGTPFWNELTIDPIRDASGQLAGFIAMHREADSVRLAVQAKEEAEAKLNSITGHIPGYIYRRVMRTNGMIELVYSSPSLAKMLEINETDVCGLFYNHVHPDDLKPLIAAIRNSAADLSVFREDFRLVSASGAVHWLRSDAPPRRMQNGEIVWDGLALEIGAERRWQSEIAELASRDPLTKLLTRAAWRQVVATQLADKNGVSQRCGLLYFDIAAFHEFNQALGSSAGDGVLCEVARRLATIAASIDGFAARLGGDEFAILIPACTDEKALVDLAYSAADVLARSILIGTQSIRIHTCIGASLYAAPLSDGLTGMDAVRELKAQTEIALRSAKQAGRGGPVLYSTALDDRFHNEAILAIAGKGHRRR
jgi:diguanylate cyclase (GGDEF)-like protein/PAS domain S-box-containing protein